MASIDASEPAFHAPRSNLKSGAAVADASHGEGAPRWRRRGATGEQVSRAEEKSVPGGNEDLITRQVRDRDELEAALRLVHDNYVERGYMQPHPSGIRIGIHYALPSTRTYVTVLRDQVIATLSLFVDSPLGLPLDALYADITGGLRVAGRGLGEVGMLADRRRALSRGVDVLLHLMRHAFWDARNDRLDDLLITVNPRHVKFYQRLLCFQQLGPVREYRAVHNAPAVPLRIEISKVQPADAPSDRIREIFFSPLEDNGPGYQMRREDLAYFFVEKTDLFGRLAEAQARAIEEQFPGLRLADLLGPLGLCSPAREERNP